MTLSQRHIQMVAGGLSIDLAAGEADSESLSPVLIRLAADYFEFLPKRSFYANCGKAWPCHFFLDYFLKKFPFKGFSYH